MERRGRRRLRRFSGCGPGEARPTPRVEGLMPNGARVGHHGRIGSPIRRPNPTTPAGRRGRLLIAVLGAFALIAFILGAGAGAGGDDVPDEAATAEAAPVSELPGGGREI